MDGGRSGAVDVAQLRIVLAHVENPSVLQAEHHRPILLHGHLCRRAVDEFVPRIVPDPSDRIVPDPSDAVARAESDGVGVINLDPTGPAGEPVRILARISPTGRDP